MDTDIVIIGSGHIGSTLARHLAALGHRVSIANSRGPASLAALAAPRSSPISCPSPSFLLRHFQYHLPSCPEKSELYTDHPSPGARGSPTSKPDRHQGCRYSAEHPRRATRAVLTGTVPPGKGGVPIQQAFLDRAFKPLNNLDDEIVLFFEPKSAVSRASAKASHDRIYARPGVAEKIPSKAEEIQAYLDAAATYRDDAPGRLEKLMASRTPILIISGDNDISTWFALKGKIPNAHLVVYPESGHGPQHQYPELAAGQIAQFQKLAIQQ